MASKSLARAQRHFDHVKGLREAKAPAKLIRKTADVWMKRRTNSVQGFHKARKPGVVITTKGAQA